MRMNKLGIAGAVLALATVFSTAAMAVPVDLTACTKDGKSVTLKIDVDGGIKDGPTLAALSQQAFGEAASEQTAEELTGTDDVFLEHLQEDLLTAAGDRGKDALTDDAAFNGFPNGAPIIGGACTAPAPAAQ
jgi:hypothetical protein